MRIANANQIHKSLFDCTGLRYSTLVTTGNLNRRRLTLLMILPAFVLLIALGISSLERPTPLAVQADRVLISKAAHTLTLYKSDSAIRTYRVALGRGGIGPKSREGDNKVPEGVYRISGRNPHSSFHRSLHISYPTADQSRQAASLRVNPGGDVMIHGIRNGLGWLGPLQRTVDWTRGCIAVTDPEIDQIWRAVPDGTPVEIRP